MTQISINYAIVLYELGIEKRFLTDTVEIFQETDALMESLTSPVIPMHTKDCIIDKVFPKEIHSFLKVLCHYHNIDEIYEIAKAYKAYTNEKNGILSATLRYVDKPDEKQAEGMKAYLRNRFHKKEVVLQYEHCPQLIGGFVLQVGDIEIDRSVAGKIKQLQEKIVKR